MKELQFKYNSFVKNDTISSAAIDSILGCFKHFNGEVVTITIKKKRHGVSKEQRGYYWAVICKAFQKGALEEWGEIKTLEECHDELKKHCNFKEEVDEEGKVKKVVLSSEKLDTFDREIYHENCRRLIFDYFGIVVNLPNENTV